jgi:hypothetical protein
MGPRVGLDAVENREMPCSCWESNPESSPVKPLARRYDDCPIAALFESSACLQFGVKYTLMPLPLYENTNF